jgi:hypothetical protein
MPDDCSACLELSRLSTNAIGVNSMFILQPPAEPTLASHPGRRTCPSFNLDILLASGLAVMSTFQEEGIMPNARICIRIHTDALFDLGTHNDESIMRSDERRAGCQS